jgi:hypothetical protein
MTDEERAATLAIIHLAKELFKVQREWYQYLKKTFPNQADDIANEPDAVEVFDTITEIGNRLIHKHEQKTPSQVSFILRTIATTIERSEYPRRDLLIEDLRCLVNDMK